MKLKEKLLGALGGFGYILWLLICIAFFVIPFVATGFPIWVSVILQALIMFTGLIGAVVTVFVYAYSFLQILHGPLDLFAVLYYIDFAVYVIFFFIPSVIQFISAFSGKNDQ